VLTRAAGCARGTAGRAWDATSCPNANPITSCTQSHVLLTVAGKEGGAVLKSLGGGGKSSSAPVATGVSTGLHTEDGVVI
jgi:hypothetical protein